MGLNKDDGESIKNDKGARTGRTALGTEPPTRGRHPSYHDNPQKVTSTREKDADTPAGAEGGRSIGLPNLFQATGVDYGSPGGTRLQVVNLTGLTPGATYFYRIGDAGMASS